MGRKHHLRQNPSLSTTSKKPPELAGRICMEEEDQLSHLSPYLPAESVVSGAYAREKGSGTASSLPFRNKEALGDVVPCNLSVVPQNCSYVHYCAESNSMPAPSTSFPTKTTTQQQQQLRHNGRISLRGSSLEHKMLHFRMKLGLSRLYELQPDPYDCSQRQYLRVCIFRDVKNAVELRRLLRRGDIDAAMIRPELVAEPFVLLVAANRAIQQAAHNRMYTRSLSAELIYSLSPTRNISESLNVFGIAENSRHLIVAIFGDASGKRMRKVAKCIDGKAAPLDTLRELRNMTLIKRVYQVEKPELNSASISDLIVGRILAKDIGV